MKVDIKESKLYLFFCELRDKFSIFFEKFNFSWQKITEYGITLCAGIFIGFLVRRYGKKLVCILFFLCAILVGLSYFNVVIFDIHKFKEIFGLSSVDTMDVVFQHYVQWVKDHVSLVITGGIGFILGYKIG